MNRSVQGIIKGFLKYQHSQGFTLIQLELKENRYLMLLVPQTN